MTDENRELPYVTINFHDQQAVVAIYAGMAVAELEDCLRGSFIISTQEKPVGIYVDQENQPGGGKSPNSVLIPLSYLAKSPQTYAGMDNITLAVKVTTPMLLYARRFQLYLLYATFAIAIFSALVWVIWRTTGVLIFDAFYVFGLIANVTYRPFLIGLYRNGPTIPFMGMSVGFWDGLSDTDFCAAVTSSTTSFWAKNPEECAVILRRKETQFYEMVEFIALLYVFFLSIRALIQSVFRSFNFNIML